MASGVGVDDDCQAKFLEMKLGHKYRYVIYRLSADNKEIVVDKTGSHDSTYDDFIEDLPEDECRWAVYDFDHKLDEDSRIRKLIFISWCPDTSRIKSKMMFASSKDTLRRTLVGIGSEIAATDMSEIFFEAVLDKVK
ncbi:cofilin [Aspergillus arachidicola]|uniref:Cofilin n=1 Tax=Aspergillus arachidicola TaxID=656916 RepID=A0A2G7FZ33_9EURO|nr:cofilin [Aspergillus arachidicola]